MAEVFEIYFSGGVGSQRFTSMLIIHSPRRGTVTRLPIIYPPSTRSGGRTCHERMLLRLPCSSEKAL